MRVYRVAVLRLLKQVIQRGHRQGRTGGVLFLTRPPRACRDRALFPSPYVEDFDEPRTKLGACFSNLP